MSDLRDGTGSGKREFRRPLSDRRRLRFPLAALMVFATAAPLTPAAQGQSPSKGAFVTRLGDDTVAMEQYTFDGRTLKGTAVVRTPRVRLWSYTATLGPGGELTSVRLSGGPPGSPAAQTGTYTYTADSVVLEVRRDTVTRTLRMAARGRPLPYTPFLFGLWELALHQARIGSGGTTLAMLSGRRVLDYTVKVAAAGDLDLSISDRDYGPLHARLDAQGRLSSFDLRGTTDKYVAERVGAVDVQALAKAFAARAQAGRGLGMLSPRDTARATIGAAHVMVDYGRPSTRGRVIFGNVVPWGAVWRTGANEATQLITDRDLVIGGTTVPAGAYSLFTIPSRRGWKLIVNKQHGQWGTEYHAERDLARLDMTTSALTHPVERLTVEIKPAGDGGVLTFSWERTTATIPFTVR